MLPSLKCSLSDLRYRGDNSLHLNLPLPPHKISYPFLFTRKLTIHCSVDEGERLVLGRKQHVKCSIVCLLRLWRPSPHERS